VARFFLEFIRDGRGAVCYFESAIAFEVASSIQLVAWIVKVLPELSPKVLSAWIRPSFPFSTISSMSLPGEEYRSAMATTKESFDSIRRLLANSDRSS
jgi:hypothetical protein